VQGDSDGDNIISLTAFRDKREASEDRLEEDLSDMFAGFPTEELRKLQKVLTDVRQSVMTEDEIRSEEQNIPQVEVIRLETALNCLHDVFNSMYSSQCYVKSDEVHQRVESIHAHLMGIHNWIRGWQSEHDE
jgi:hypothetical protein